MNLIWEYISLGTCVFLGLNWLDFWFGFKKICRLTPHTPTKLSATPKVSIILSALNEAEKINDALLSLLTLNYPNYEIIAVNDRSTDRTPIILTNLEKQFSHLTIIHVDKLPKGWLGKNHALQQGASKANSEWLLFTDADVYMHPDTLVQTLNYAVENNIEHLTLRENHLARPLGLKIFLLANYLNQSMFMKPWALRKIKSRMSYGNGAFNLIKSSTYQLCGGHKAIAMQCLDDLQLGKLVKLHHRRQDIVDGQQLVSREWYKSLPDIICGFKKNTFAFFNYQLPVALGAVIFVGGLYLLPLYLVFMATGLTQVLAGFNIIIALGLNRIITKEFGLNHYITWCYPLSVIFLMTTILISTFATYKNRGVIWRGTLYSLKELRGLG